MTRITKLVMPFIALGLLLNSLNANAKVPSYKIEVIVFESLALSGWTEEYWPEETITPDTSNSTSVFTRNQKPLWIGSASHGLTGKARALNKKGYRVLFHKAWRQLAYANKNGHQVMIEGSNQYGSSVLGTVRLYKTRYAHVDLDLEFTRTIPSQVKEAFAQAHNTTVENLPNQWRFNLSESRKIRPSELHYIDHPLFGVLVKITPLN